MTLRRERTRLQTRSEYGENFMLTSAVSPMFLNLEVVQAELSGNKSLKGVNVLLLPFFSCLWFGLLPVNY